MYILVGLAAGVALLYFWLIGHWFARVLVFLLLACGGFLAGAAIGAQANDHSSWIVLGMIGAGLTWPLASLPIYYQRYQQRLPQWWRP